MSHSELETLILTRRWQLGKQHDLHDLADALLSTESIVPTLRSLARPELVALASGSAGGHARMLLLADASGMPYPEVASLLPALLDQPTPIESETVGDSTSIALHSVVALRDLVEWVAGEPLTMGATGSLLRAEEKTLAAGLVVSEEDAIALARIAEAAGLVRTIDRRLYATTRGIDLSDDLVALWSAAFGAIVADLGSSVLESCAAASRLDEPFVEWLLPLRDTHESEILRRVASESRLFGLTAGGTTELGRTAIADLESVTTFFTPLLPELQTSVYVLDDLSIIAPGPITTGTAQFLAQISRLETRGLAPKRRLDPSLILRAVATGTTVESIVTRLTELSLTPVSAAVTSTIADIANNGRFITLNGTGTDTAAKASHPELGAMLLSDPRLQRLAPVKVDDLTVLYGASRLRVETALVENRYTVVAPAAEPVIVDPAVPTALLELAESLFATGLGSTHLERALITAGKTRSKVTLLVETSTGNKTITLEPRHVANGRVRGLDTVADVERTLPISAIIELLAVGE
jgi:hypothetical protein